jgi:pyrroloquinoline quinone (PQQ) biosynthesis protein C
VAPALRRHYGFSEYDTVFFSEHITADEKHGDLGLEMVAEVSGTHAEQEEALEGVRQGVLAWRWLHNIPARVPLEPGTAPADMR